MAVRNWEGAEARRRQIVLATIEVLAQERYLGTSFERVRAEAGISSTRLISYHFAGKDDLLRSVLQHIVEGGAAAITEAVVAAGTDGRARLRAYIESNVAYLAARPAYARAAIEIVGHLALPDGTPDRTVGQESVRRLRELLEEGQRTGALPAFDAHVMATVIRAGIDAVGGLIADHPDDDLTTLGQELADTFDRATRAEQTARAPRPRPAKDAR